MQRPGSSFGRLIELGLVEDALVVLDDLVVTSGLSHLSVSSARLCLVSSPFGRISTLESLDSLGAFKLSQLFAALQVDVGGRTTTLNDGALLTSGLEDLRANRDAFFAWH